MFTKREITLMHQAGIKLDFSHTENFSDDDWIHIEDVIGEWIQLHCYCDGYDLTPDGLICLDILEKLSKLD